MANSVVVATFVATTRWAAGAQEHAAVEPGISTTDHLFQARFPSSMYDWLRAKWFERRVAMTSVVITAVTEAHSGLISLERGLELEAASREDAAQRFTVRLPQRDYEWLRLEAFQRRVPINRLLVAALEAYRQHMAAGSETGDEAETGDRTGG